MPGASGNPAWRPIVCRAYHMSLSKKRSQRISAGGNTPRRRAWKNMAKMMVLTNAWACRIALALGCFMYFWMIARGTSSGTSGFSQA